MVTFTVNNIKFSYPGVAVLNGITMEVRPGEILAIVGQNGAGKSTLLKCMNRILEPDQGKVLLNERPIKTMGRKELAKSMAYLSQKASYTFPITVFDVVLSGRYPHRSWNTSHTDEYKVEDVLKTLGLEPLSMRYFNELSGGQQQQVLIARSLVQEAAIFLFDEPTSDLDIRHQLEVMETIHRIVQEKKVAAVVTIHDLNLASRYADRIIMLKDGLILAVGSPGEVFNETNIAKAYGVEVVINHLNDKPHIIPVSPLDLDIERKNHV